MAVGQWRLGARLSELATLHREVASFVSHNGLCKKLGGELSLVLEEWFVNVVTHGLKSRDRPVIEITLRLEGEWLFLLLKDNGIPFDPWQVASPDILTSLHERPVGGLGIHMIQSIMDRCEYSREGEFNLSRLMKKIRRCQ